MASAPVPSNALRLEDSLQTVLRSIGSVDCVAAADRLAEKSNVDKTLILHLRTAGIDADAAARIATALASVTDRERARLGSFSLSYNSIGDAGALALATTLPPTLGDLGLVDCSIGDSGGEAILEWAGRASGLRMICIEDNEMSRKMRERFVGLRKLLPNLAVFV